MSATARATTVVGDRLQAGSYSQMAILAIGFIMATLDVTIVNVAGSNIGTSLHIGLPQITWVIDGYMLTFASFLLLAGTLAGRYGAKHVYVTGLGVFTLASAVSASAPSGTVLIGARLVQGVGAALFMPSSMALLARAFPDPAERGKALGLFSAIVSTASGLGPFVGGAVIAAAGWRAIFLLNLPLGVAGLILAARMVPGTDRGHAVIPIGGHILGILSLVGLSFALIEGPARGWTDATVVLACAVAAACSTAFVITQRRSRTPVVPTVLFRNSAFTGANTIGLLLNLGLFGGMYMLSLYLQRGRGVDAWTAGLQLLPMMIVFVVGNLIFARIVKKFGAYRPLAASLTAAASGAAFLISTTDATPYWILGAVMAVVNLAIGITVPAMTSVLLAAAGPTQAGMGGATLNANRQIGALVGVALMGSLVSRASTWSIGASHSFIAMTVAYATAAALAWRLLLKTGRVRVDA